MKIGSKQPAFSVSRDLDFVPDQSYKLEYLVRYRRQFTAQSCARLRVWHSRTLTAGNKNGIMVDTSPERFFITPPGG